MSDPTTPNKGIDLPSTGEYNNAWGPVVNQNFTDIDTALGGVTAISLTGLTPGNHGLSLTQYQPINIEFTGTMTGNFSWYLPPGVGGIWSVYNNTTGSYGLGFASSLGGSLYVVPQGQRVLLVCDGTSMQLATQVAGASANPSALVGLAAVNGTAVTFMTSDSAPALNQSIAPTWSNEHIFAAQVVFEGSVAVGNGGGLTIEAGSILNASPGEILVATATVGDNSARAASTAFVSAAIPGILANAALTGTPTTPTAASGTNNTQVASTAFAQGPARNLAANGYVELPSGLIIQWGINTFSSTGSSITFSAVGGIRFPNNFFMGIANAYGSAATAYVQSGSQTTLSAVNGISSTNSWIAFGN